ncbi:uncharacterized protein LOC113492915 [Trichoplusia ni]|uniref:Uncharacterized protein LOC113492915 n=1 Tax=Trichoplusia ni TaxID=7111 RepID=A0A7E5VDR3_TRINI|nr:uncharacterized protein LOC113492915 [Trichoplusia ni]
MRAQLFLGFFVWATAVALDSGDNKFMKDYAMLKIYESCFGTALLKQITKELKDAYAKCSTAPPMKEPLNSHIPPLFLSKLPPGFAMDPNTQTITKPLDGAVPNKDEDGPIIQDQGQQPQKQTLGGVLTFRPNGVNGPFPQPQAAVPPYMIPTQFRPYSANPYYQMPYNTPVFYPPNVPYNPYFAQQQYQQGYYQQQQPFFANNRMSRHLGLRARLALNARGQQNQNVTCVMQELGYIDSNMEPNYEQITQRINNLPVSNELKGDIQEGLQFCQKFSQCVPEDKRDIVPRPQEQIRAIFFFRCYKHKKLEACIMKDINQHFNKEYMFDSDTDFALSRQARSVRDVPLRDPSIEALEEMEVYLYDYLSGGGGFDFDLYI